MGNCKIQDMREQESMIRILPERPDSVPDMAEMLKTISAELKENPLTEADAVILMGSGMTCQCYRHEREQYILKILRPGKVEGNKIVPVDPRDHLNTFLSSVAQNGIVWRKYVASHITFTQHQELVLTTAGLGVKIAEAQSDSRSESCEFEAVLIRCLNELLDVAEDLEIWHSSQECQGTKLPSLLNLDVKPANYVHIAFAKNGRHDIVRSVDYGSCMEVGTLLNYLKENGDLKPIFAVTTPDYYPDGTCMEFIDKLAKISPSDEIITQWLYRLDLGAALRMFHERLVNGLAGDAKPTKSSGYCSGPDPYKCCNGPGSAMPGNFMELCYGYMPDKNQVLVLYQALHLIYTVYLKVFTFPEVPDDCSAAWLTGKVKEALTILNGSLYQHCTEAETDACCHALLRRNSFVEKDETVLGRMLKIESCADLMVKINPTFKSRWPTPAELYHDILFGRFPASDNCEL